MRGIHLVMRVLEFATYQEYFDAQVTLTRHKLAKAGRSKVFTSPAVACAIHRFLESHGKRAGDCLCHGVRTGLELDLFESILGGSWIGTEITPELCDERWLYHWDFSQPRPEWLGRFDLVYSNSFDHSRTPEATAAVWLNQLNSQGTLFVEWTEWHCKLGRYWKADCFAATKDEYGMLFDAVGRLVDVIEIRDADAQGNRVDRVLFAMDKKNPKI